jgi:hypothetical protein
MYLDRLNHSDQPPEAQSPFKAAAVTSLVSFIFFCWLDHRAMSSLRIWWAELLVYAFVPILLAFIILYRSSWHREFGAWARALVTALVSCVIFCGVMIAFGILVALVSLAYISSFDHFLRFHC